MTSKNPDGRDVASVRTTERESKGEKEFEEALRQKKGEGVEQDMRKAAQHLEKAVELNHWCNGETGQSIRVWVGC